MECIIYRPVAGSAFARHLYPGSAVVGRRPTSPGPDIAGLVDCWFDGSTADNMQTWFARLCNAAGRMSENYPTVARMAVPEKELVPLARFDAVRQVVIEILDQEQMEAYAAELGADLAIGKLYPAGTTLPMHDGAWTEILAAANALPYQGRHGLKALLQTHRGQILVCDLATRQASVHNAEEPGLRDMLSRQLRLSDHEIRRLFPQQPSPAANADSTMEEPQP